MATKEASEKVKEKTPQPAPEKPKSFKEAEAVALTDSEREQLSREQILAWYRAQRNEKLKALYGEIELLTQTEKDNLRKKIFERTLEELSKLNKDLPLEEKKKIAEKFSDKLFNSTTEGQFEEALEELNVDDMDQKKFFMYLNMHGSVATSQRLMKLKGHPQIQEVFKSNPALELKYDKIVESGDINEIAELLKEIHPDFKNADPEYVYFMVAMFAEQSSPIEEMMSKVPLIGDAIKNVYSWGKKAKEVMHFPLFKKTANKLGVGTLNLISVAGMTVFELKDRERVFEKYMPLLEKMQETSVSKSKKKSLENKIKFINEIKIISKNVTEIQDKHGDLIREGVQKYLDQQKGLSDEDKMKIITELDLDSLRVQMYYPAIAYGVGEKKNDSTLFQIAELAARGKRLNRGVGFARGVLGGAHSYESALAVIGVRRIWEQNTRNFKNQLSKFDDIKKMEPLVAEFHERVKKFAVETSTQGGEKMASDMMRHDDILRQYYELSLKYSKIMSDRANAIAAAGFELDKLPKTGNVNVSSLSEGTRKALGITAGEVNVDVVRKKYFEELIAVRQLRDDVQTRFALISNDIRTNVIKTFDEKWVRKMDIQTMEKTLLKETKDIKEYLSPTKRAAYWGKMLALPTIAVGVPMIDYARGKSRWHDVKWDVFDATIGFVPVAGTINDFKQMWQGKTTAGRKLSTRERVVSGVFGVVGAISDAAWVLGGLGGWMRAGIGGLRASKRLAQVGEVARSAKAIDKEVEFSGGVYTTAKWFGMRGISKTDRQVQTVARTDLYEFMSLQKKLEDGKMLDKVDDIKEGEKLFDTASEYKKLRDQHGGIDYYAKLKEQFGVSENPIFLEYRLRRNKAKVAKMYEEIGATEDLNRVVGAGRKLGDYDKLMDEKNLVQEAIAAKKAQGAADIAAEEAKLAKINADLKPFIELENRAFAKAERMAQTSLLLKQASRYAMFGGLGVAAVSLLTGVSPTASKVQDTAMKYAEKGASAGYKAGSWALDKSWNVQYPPSPFEDLVESYVETKRTLNEFQTEYDKIEKSNDPKKKEQIESLCATHWDNPHVQAWVIKHKDKLDMKKIIDKVKNVMMLSRKQFQMQQMGGGMPANLDLLEGKRGAAGIEQTGQ